MIHGARGFMLSRAARYSRPMRLVRRRLRGEAVDASWLLGTVCGWAVFMAFRPLEL